MAPDSLNSRFVAPTGQWDVLPETLRVLSSSISKEQKLEKLP